MTSPHPSDASDVSDASSPRRRPSDAFDAPTLPGADRSYAATEPLAPQGGGWRALGVSRALTRRIAGRLPAPLTRGRGGAERQTRARKLLLAGFSVLSVVLVAAIGLLAAQPQAAGKRGLALPGYSTPTYAQGTVPAVVPSNTLLDKDAVAEYQALIALVPTDKATDVAVASGLWSDPHTWRSGHIPAAHADVWIPQGLLVTYDAQSDVSLHTLRVDGAVRFVTEKTTQLVVDTVVVTPTGYWEIGAGDNPVKQGVTATVTIADNGPIDTTWDPTQLSRGFISTGKTVMNGAAKTTFLPLAKAPKAGDTTLLLSQPPANWQPGDIVVLTGNEYRDYMPNKQRADEKRTITAITGPLVTLDAPLQFDHTPPAPDLHGYVANYTRNIVFQSANTKDISHRGHVMFMHSDQVTVNAVEFNELGRTNKAEWADDPGVIRKGQDHTTEGKGLNPRGRYAVHFHRDGMDASKAPAVVKDSTVIGSPGWGFVNHDSNVDMEDNAAYNVLGAAFVAENGDEIGLMKHNIAIGSDGSQSVGHRQYPTGGPHTDPPLQDMWHDGQGFAFRGQGVRVEDNVASDLSSDAYAWDNWDSPNYGMPASNLPVPALAKNAAAVNFPEVPIYDFKGNTAIASYGGVRLEAIGMHISDARNLLEDFTAWNPGHDGGILMRYSNQTTLRAIRLVDTHGYTNQYDAHTGIALGPRDSFYVLDNVRVSGFHVAVDNKEGQETGDNTHPETAVVLDSAFTNNDTTFASDDPAYLTQGSKAGLDLNRLDFIPSPGQNMAIAPGQSFLYYGKIADGLGEYAANVGPDNWMQYFGNNGDDIKAVAQRGYYTRSDGSAFLVLNYAIFNRITGAPKTIHAELTIRPGDWSGIGPNLGAYKDA